jgi:hypothetical protein
MAITHLHGSSPFSIQATIHAEDVHGGGGANSPWLKVRLKLELRKFHADDASFSTLHIIQGRLALPNQIDKLSECTVLLNSRLSSDGQFGFDLDFPISREHLEKIESTRKDSVSFTLNLNLQISTSEKVYLNVQGENVQKEFISGFHNPFGNMGFEIAQSQWVSSILPSLGYGSYKLIEIPIASEVIPKEYDISLLELESAHQYFKNSDFDKAVSHCRSALEPFKNNPNYADLKKFVSSRSEHEWASKVLESTDEWLDKMIKATSAFTSKPHHAPSVGHFSRRDAEIIMMITTGIIAYIGKLGFKKEN